MKTIRLLISLFFLFLFSLGCKKKVPEANFKINKYEYAAGEMIEYENLSLNYKTLKWEIIDKAGAVDSVFEENNPVLVLDILASDGEYKIKLTAENKKKTSVEEKNILIKSVKSYLNINVQNSGDYTDYEVYVDKQYVGSANIFGEFQVSIPIGLRLVEIVASNETYSQAHEFEESSSVYITF